MKLKVFPQFLEGPVRYMKTIEDDHEKMEDMYNRVLTSGLRDTKLDMYFLSASLKGQSYDMGRQISFAPGWLENQSIWMHMSYKVRRPLCLFPRCCLPISKLSNLALFLVLLTIAARQALQAILFGNEEWWYVAIYGPTRLRSLVDGMFLVHRFVSLPRPFYCWHRLLSAPQWFYCGILGHVQAHVYRSRAILLE